MYAERKQLLESWEKARSAKALLYVTGDRQNAEIQIHPEVLDRFIHHLDQMGDPQKISLILYTRGGVTLGAWSLVHLIRQFCKELEVIIPSKAHSAGTLICLGADRIMMTKQATLGPIDPSVNGPLNPQILGAPPGARVPVSAEAVNGFIDFAKTSVGLKENDLRDVFLHLASQVHPLVLGDIHRARTQIRMLAERLIIRQVTDTTKIKKILDFLCSESGSHDYSIYRQEARDVLGLAIDRPDDALYAQIKAIYDDFACELRLNEPFSQELELGSAEQINYELRRGLVESVSGGSHVFVSRGQMTRRQIQAQPGVLMQGVESRLVQEGWIHENG